MHKLRNCALPCQVAAWPGSAPPEPAGVLCAVLGVACRHGRLPADARRARPDLPAVPRHAGALGSASRAACGTGGGAGARLRHALARCSSGWKRSGLVERRRSAEDERRVEVHLTDAGRGPQQPAAGRASRQRSAATPPGYAPRTGPAPRNPRQAHRRPATDSRLGSPQVPTTASPHRPERNPMKTLYTAEALASGEGRDGTAVTKDGKLDVDPRQPGGAGRRRRRAPTRSSSSPPATPPASTPPCAWSAARQRPT